MAQTVGAMSWENAKVEFSTDAAFTYVTDISGSTNKVTSGGGEISKATAYTHGTKVPLSGYGGAADRTLEIGVLYTEVNDEAFDLANDAYDNNTDIWIRVTPDGVAGTKEFVTSVGRILTPPQIAGEAGLPDFTMTTFTVTCATLTWQDVA